MNWIVLMLLCLFGASFQSAHAQAAKTIDINAVIRVTVANEPDLTGLYTVDANGNISMLYVNQVHLAGLTVSQAVSKLESKQYLGKYYVNPQVAVSIVQPGGITVTVSGDVTGQKDYTVRSDAHLSEVLPVADPLPDADLSKVQITHGLPGEANQPTETVNYLLFRDQNNPAGNPKLHDGDVIYVPSKTPVPIQVTFSGDWTKAGLQAVPAGTTAYNAIQLNGGLPLTADPTAIVIQRYGASIPFDYYKAATDPSNPQVNPVLQDGDTLIAAAHALTSNSYTISGAVRNAGSFPLNQPYTTLAQVIGVAGGITPGARMNEVNIIRPTPNGQAKPIKVNADSAAVQGNTRIYPGDNIVIPQGRPGFSPDPITIISALGTLAGIAYLFHL